VIVVSDTTPLNYLVLIDEIDVLPKLFVEVVVPPSVLDELTRAKTPQKVRGWAESPHAWLKIAAPIHRLPSTALLGDGEADAISLAKERQIIDLLIDERRGRNIARREGLVPLPTLAVLERAAIAGLLQLRPTIERLQQTNIRIPQDRIDAALARDARRRHQK
jgi:predicted nucleic acid-binding protein